MANPLDDILGDFRDERAQKALELARRLGILPEDGSDEAETTPLTPEVLDVLRRMNDLLEAPDELRALQMDATILQTSPPSGDASLDATLLETSSPSGDSSTDATVLEVTISDATVTSESEHRPSESAKFGRFTDVEFLTEGGMGQILEATDPAIDRRVAIKILQPDIESHQFHLVKFRNEFRLTGQLEHPSIVPVHETGHHPRRHQVGRARDHLVQECACQVVVAGLVEVGQVVVVAELEQLLQQVIAA